MHLLQVDGSTKLSNRPVPADLNLAGWHQQQRQYCHNNIDGSKQVNHYAQAGKTLMHQQRNVKGADNF
jgi:hypothetical protein